MAFPAEPASPGDGGIPHGIFHDEGCACAICAGPPERSTADTDTPDAPGAGAATKPVYTGAQIVDALTTQDGARASLAWAGGTVSFSVGTGRLSPGHSEYDPEHTGYTPMQAGMEAVAAEAFALWDELIAIDLVERDNDPFADIVFNYSSNTSGGGTYAQYTYTAGSTAGRADYRMIDSDIWFADDWYTHNQASDLVQGSYGLMTYIHEIGHALGLSHPGAYNGSASFGPDATHFQDTRAYTVMSYFNAQTNGSGTDHVGSAGRAYGSTPLLHDILAIQAVYGADMTTRTGDTVYGFNANAGREAFDFTVNRNPVVAIWDAGGNDRLDLSGWDTDQAIDLREGAFSSAGQLTDNIAIAYGAVIEEAVGGAGHDLITGNDAANRLWGGAGDDLIDGGAGDDELWGGAGSDTLWGGDGDDAFLDLETGDTAHGGAGLDTVRFDREGPGVTVALTGSTGIERIHGTQSADIITGTAEDDTLFGGGGADRLMGGDGADWLYGHVVGDFLYGGAGADVLIGGAGADLMDGGAGMDTARYTGADGAIGVDLETGGFAGEADGDVFVSIETVLGSRFADTIRGDAAGNTLRGRDGDDILSGRGGNDRISGDAGNDRADGGAGNDLISGGAGDDTLTGGTGDDRLWGGTGADLFLFAAGDGDDSIQDFALGVDLIGLTGTAGFAALSVQERATGALIGHGDGDTLFLDGVFAADITEDLFLFA